jgi:hypothetical protein
MPILERLQNHFQGYVWKHVLSMLVGLMLLREAKTLTALKYHESLPTLSRTLNVYPWPLDELRAVRRALITQALNRLTSAGQRAWEVPEETIASLQGLEIPVVIVHRGRGKGRRTVISTDLSLFREQILRHIKRRWGIEVLFKLLKEQFGLGDCRCRGEKSLARWVELVLLAYVLAGLTRWGKQLLGEQPSWGEVRQSWGWTLIQTATEVRGWLATLGRLILWGFQTLCPLSIPKLEQEAILTS